jgi:hypothetical protein
MMGEAKRRAGRMPAPRIGGLQQLRHGLNTSRFTDDVTATQAQTEMLRMTRQVLPPTGLLEDTFFARDKGRNLFV